MIDLWNRLEDYLRANAPSVLPTLNPPATDAQIARAEQTLGVRFPADLSASLKIHNGQIQETGRGNAIPLVPEEFDRKSQGIATWGELAPIDHIVDSTEMCRQVLAAMSAYLLGSVGGDDDDEDYDDDNDDDDAADEILELRGPVRRDGKWNFVTFVDAGSGDTLGLDLAPGTGGSAGQVVSVVHDPTSLIVIASGYREWFELLVERYEAGRYFFGPQEGALMALDRWNPDV